MQLAIYHGICACCGDSYGPGTPIMYSEDNDGWAIRAHVNGPGRLDDKICPVCRMTISRNGSCGCD